MPRGGFEHTNQFSSGPRPRGQWDHLFSSSLFISSFLPLWFLFFLSIHLHFSHIFSLLCSFSFLILFLSNEHWQNVRFLKKVFNSFDYIFAIPSNRTLVILPKTVIIRHLWSWGNSVIGLQTGRPSLDSRQRQSFRCTLASSHRLWSPSVLLSNGYQERFLRG
jgi:hypothetical protein